LNQIPHPWALLGSVLAHPGLDSSLLELKVLIPFWTRTPSQFGLVSSIFFLNSSGQLTWVTFTLSAYPNPTRTACPNSTRAPYPSSIPESCSNSLPELHLSTLPDRINAYLALYVHTQPNYLTRFFSWLDFYLPGLTQSYPAKLPYPISSQSDFCLPDRTRPPYPISLPGWVTPRCTQLLTRPYPITLPGRVPFNWPHPKTSSSASHLDLGLLLAIKIARVALSQPG
jgi:hypothetical protein